ncbi:MAG TPA: hypothetical protein VLT47_14430 [Anaeromyxobacteraceae bacterium]|nr:hypothetical protein [Anaeromyxobacteraceae bacterium]
MDSTKPLGVFEVSNSRSSHIVTLFARDMPAMEQEWEWGKAPGPEHGRGMGDPRSPLVNVLPVGAVEEMVRAAVLAEREACAKVAEIEGGTPWEIAAAIRARK